MRRRFYHGSDMIAGAIEDENGMATCRDFSAD
jgi:hypothetical protein